MGVEGSKPPTESEPQVPYTAFSKAKVPEDEGIVVVHERTQPRPCVLLSTHHMPRSAPADPELSKLQALPRVGSFSHNHLFQFQPLIRLSVSTGLFEFLSAVQKQSELDALEPGPLLGLLRDYQGTMRRHAVDVAKRQRVLTGRIRDVDVLANKAMYSTALLGAEVGKNATDMQIVNGLRGDLARVWHSIRSVVDSTQKLWKLLPESDQEDLPCFHWQVPPDPHFSALIKQSSGGLRARLSRRKKVPVEEEKWEVVDDEKVEEEEEVVEEVVEEKEEIEEVVEEEEEVIEEVVEEKEVVEEVIEEEVIEEVVEEEKEVIEEVIEEVVEEKEEVVEEEVIEEVIEEKEVIEEVIEEVVEEKEEVVEEEKEELIEEVVEEKEHKPNHGKRRKKKKKAQ